MNINEKIIKTGTIVSATKLPVITIGIGRVSELKDLPDTIWHEDGKVVIATKEAPEGCTYEQDRIVVVRVIGDKVKMNGLFDIYAPNSNKIEKLLSNPIELSEYLKPELMTELQPVLAVASEVRPSLAPAETGRKVIIITKEMVGERGYTECHCPWDPDDVLTKLFVGDIFLVEDKKTYTGYRIGKEEFEGTYALD